MGNIENNQAEEGRTIGKTYLKKVLKGVKKEVDSSIEIECNSTSEMYI
jgi:hypothetical protein